jgi:CHRD domain/PEP-CTERM motif
MMKFNMLTAGLLLATIAAPAAAVDSVFKAELNGPSESPPNDSHGMGTATITINQGTMHVHESFSGLSTGNTASHIHCCTTDPGIGTAGVATTIPTFTDFPSGVTAGTYDHTFDMLNASSYNPAFISGHGGTTAGAFAALLAGLNEGRAYANIHTTTFPLGEIRGFPAPIPEPETYAMFVAGLGAMGALIRRRRR